MKPRISIKRTGISEIYKIVSLTDAMKFSFLNVSYGPNDTIAADTLEKLIKSEKYKITVR